MKKIVSFLLLCAAFSVHAATVFTFTTNADKNQTKDGITVVLAKGNGTEPEIKSEYGTDNKEMRMYVGNTITLSSETALTNIQMVFAKSLRNDKAYTGLSASTGTLVSGGVSTDKTDWKVDSWTGDATQVVFTLTDAGQRQIQRILIDGEPIVIEPVEEPALPTADDLDLSYEYLEPEIIHVPDTQIFQKEYAFIDGNILVHCSKGSIVKASDTEDAYFGCQENQTLTFTATIPFKGIAIKGNVRNNFTATCDKGDLSFLSDEDVETAADPVLVIRNINSSSVTITTKKNLSCYEVKAYFEENPQPVGEEIIVPGDTLTLNYDTASVALDKDESEELGKFVYTLYIWDKTNEWIYLALDIHTDVENKFAGTYSIEGGNMTNQSLYQFGEEYEEYSSATEGQMVINKQNGLYSISGYITCENHNTYNFSFTGAIEGGEDEDEQGFEAVESGKAGSQKILRNGQILILRGEKTYTILGAEVQ